MSNVTKQQIQETLEAARSAQTAQTAQYSNRSPMRGRYRDSQRVTVNQQVLDKIARNNSARDQFCLTPLTDMTGRDTVILSAARSGHTLIKYANVFRSVSISKTGRANVLTSELFSAYESYQDIKERHIQALKRRGLDVNVIDILEPQRHTAAINKYAEKYTVLVTRSTNSRGDFSFQSWAFDGHNLAVADVLTLPAKGSETMRDTDFMSYMNRVKSHTAAALNIRDDQLDIKYMGAVSIPLTI